MVVKPLVLPYFCEVIKTGFSHYEDFNNFPSQVYPTIIIFTCNTSAEVYIEGA